MARRKKKTDADGVSVPKVRVGDDVVRAARLLSEDFFEKLEGDNRKVAVLTLKRGFMPMLRNGPKAIDAICNMCSEAQGKSYNPLRCMKVCPMMKAAQQMEELYTTLGTAISKFIADGGATDGDTGTVKGPKKTSPSGGDGGHEDRNAPVPA